MDQVRNEEVQRRTGAMRVGWSSRGVCVELVWTYGENGGRSVSEDNNRIKCERFKVERKRKATNGMDGWCEKSIE